jgi:hypothetical protein
LLAQVSALVNSRPLTPVTSDPDDLIPLTPAHFLIRRPYTSNPEPLLFDISFNRLDDYQQIQQLYQEFSVRYHTEYLSLLQERNKWTHPQRKFQLNDVVLIMEDNVKPDEWVIGRITHLKPAQDGLTRSVTVRSRTTYDKKGKLIFKEQNRPIVKLCLLPFEELEKFDASNVVVSSKRLHVDSALPVSLDSRNSLNDPSPVLNDIVGSAGVDLHWASDLGDTLVPAVLLEGALNNSASLPQQTKHKKQVKKIN